MRKLRKNPKFRLIESDGAFFLHRKKSNEGFEVSPSTVLVWDLVDGERSAEQIAEALQRRVEGDWSGIRSDVLDLVGQLVEREAFQYASGHAGTVRIRYRNRLGNRMFSYCAGRILAQRLDYKLVCEPVHGFVNTVHEDKAPKDVSGDDAAWHVVGTCADIEKVIATHRPPLLLEVDGLFQDYPFLKPYREEIRSRWLAFEEPPPAVPGPEDMVIHIRSGDVWYWNRAPGQGAQDPLPISFYIDVIESDSFRELYIVCEDRDNPMARFLSEKYGGVIINGDEIKDFRFLCAANRMALSSSTFAWWAGWLSGAEAIHFPEIDYFGRDNGNWYREHEKINIVVDDDPAYIRHPLNTYPDPNHKDCRNLSFLFGDACAELPETGALDWIDAAVFRTGPGNMETCRASLRNKVLGLRDIHVVDPAEVDEERLPFSFGDVLAALEDCGRPGRGFAEHHFSQLCKLYLPFMSGGNDGSCLVVDDDIELLNGANFFRDGRAMLMAVRGHSVGHCEFLARALPGLVKQAPDLRAARGFTLVEREWVTAMMDAVERAHGKPFWRAYLESIDPRRSALESASVEELYFQFVLRERVPRADVRVLEADVVEKPQRYDMNTARRKYHYVAGPHPARLFFMKTGPFEPESVVLINRQRDGERRKRFLAQARDEGIADKVTVFEAVEGAALSDEDVRAHTTVAGYSGYRRYRSGVHAGSLTRPSLGCALSWKHVFSDIDSITLVLEDDAVLCEGFVRRFRDCSASIPLNWDLVYLSWNGTQAWDNTGYVDDNVRQVTFRIHGMGAVLVHPRCREKLLSVFPLDLQIDHDIPDKLIQPGLVNAYLFTDSGNRLVYNDNMNGSTTQVT